MDRKLQLLHARLQKLDERRFDLNAWKQGTIAAIDSILGRGNLKCKQIEDIDFQNNSWSLRDTTGDVDSVKKTCADVLEAIIMEIETFGLAENIILDKKEKETPCSKVIEEAMKKELSQSQLDELMDLINSKEVSFTDVVDKFKRYGYEVAPKIMASLLLNTDLKKGLW